MTMQKMPILFHWITTSPIVIASVRGMKLGTDSKVTPYSASEMFCTMKDTPTAVMSGASRGACGAACTRPARSSR